MKVLPSFPVRIPAPYRYDSEKQTRAPHVRPVYNYFPSSYTRPAQNSRRSSASSVRGESIAPRSSQRLFVRSSSVGPRPPVMKEITVLHSELHYAFQPAGIVSHRIVIQHVYPHLIQLLREISRIGIDHLPRKEVLFPPK